MSHILYAYITHFGVILSISLSCLLNTDCFHLFSQKWVKKALLKSYFQVDFNVQLNERKKPHRWTMGTSKSFFAYVSL